MKNVHIISGGTINYIRPHFALCAPAYGSTGRKLEKLCNKIMFNDQPEYASAHLHSTKMAGGNLETNEDIYKLLQNLVENDDTHIIFMPVALCDYYADSISVYDGAISQPTGKNKPRIKTSNGNVKLWCKPSRKLIGDIRKWRKDIFLVGFKTTSGATEDDMFNAGMKLLKTNSCNLVLVNDLKSRLNMIVTPEMARYCVTTARDEVLEELVSMTHSRSQLTFHRTNMASSLQLIKWDSHRVPEPLRKVVDYCVEHGAYQAFNGVTVGHFGVFQNTNAILKEINQDMIDREFSEGDRICGIAAAISHGSFQLGIPCELPGTSVIYSSRRKKNYNKPEDKDLVVVVFDKEGQPTAYGAKPSAGVRSQYEVFKANPGFDCVIHFHCKLKEGSTVNVRPQQHLECGSLECGMNTRDGMTQYTDDIKAVMLDKHGPNILFKRNANPQKVIDFIETNFDLNKPTSEVK